MLDPGNSSHVFLSDRIGRVNNVRYDGYRSWKSLGEQIGTERKAVVGGSGGGDDSGVCSPPLWRTSPSSSPQHRKSHYQSLSPSSRTQAIARGQRELMEMVSRMPESSYELSMKDLVEQQPMIEVKQESFREEKSVRSEKGVLKKNEKKKVQMMKRSGSVDDERLLLKMVFPVFLGSKKNPKKKNDSLPNNSKITPKSPVCDGSDKGVDKEWWKKRFSASTETESIGSSSNSASAKSSASSRSSSQSSSTSSRQQGSGGCWSFMRTKKGKRVE